MSQETIYAVSYWLSIVDGLTAANGVPTTSGQGVDIRRVSGHARHGKVTIGKLRHSATGARTATIRIYGWAPNEKTAEGVEIANSEGWVDSEETMVLSSTTTDGQFAQVFESLSVFERIYAELEAVTGTAGTISFSLGLTDE